MVRSDSPQEYESDLMALFIFIVHHHGGRIEARAADPRGTVFSLRLPTDPNLLPAIGDNQEFLQKVLVNQALWEEVDRGGIDRLIS